MFSELSVWEGLKNRAANFGLTLVIDKSVVRVENTKTEGVYFQAKSLREIDIYISGYDYGRRDTKLTTQK